MCVFLCLSTMWLNGNRWPAFAFQFSTCKWHTALKCVQQQATRYVCVCVLCENCDMGLTMRWLMITFFTEWNQGQWNQVVLSIQTVWSSPWCYCRWRDPLLNRSPTPYRSWIFCILVNIALFLRLPDNIFVFFYSVRAIEEPVYSLPPDAFPTPQNPGWDFTHLLPH